VTVKREELPDIPIRKSCGELREKCDIGDGRRVSNRRFYARSFRRVKNAQYLFLTDT